MIKHVKWFCILYTGKYTVVNPYPPETNSPFILYRMGGRKFWIWHVDSRRHGGGEGQSRQIWSLVLVFLHQGFSVISLPENGAIDRRIETARRTNWSTIAETGHKLQKARGQQGRPPPAHRFSGSFWSVFTIFCAVRDTPVNEMPMNENHFLFLRLDDW
jgi:hypothetical protein